MSSAKRFRVNDDDDDVPPNTGMGSLPLEIVDRILTFANQSPSNDPATILPHPCAYRSFMKGQLEAEGVYPLDEFGNRLIIIHNVLPPAQLAEYSKAAVIAPRDRGMVRSFGKLIPKPREEISYTRDARPYRYSGVEHHTTLPPPHVQAILPFFDAAVIRALQASGDPGNDRSFESDTIVDIKYSSAIPLGGSIAAHADDEGQWPRVRVFSLGQERTMIFKTKAPKKVRNQPAVEFRPTVVAVVKLSHNSLVVMDGPPCINRLWTAKEVDDNSFQQRYTHEVPKLLQSEPIYDRYSLNDRLIEHVPFKAM